MSTRAKIPLSDLITLQRGFDLPTARRKEGDVPVIASTGIAGYHNEAKVQGPGVVIGRSGSIGGGQYAADDFWPLNTTLWVKDFKGNNPRFTYYLLKGIDFTRFNAGAGVPTLNRNHIASLRVSRFSPAEQVRIASILSAYDDLIENNRRRIQLLEESARLLYREWFVRLRFPGHEHVKIIDGVPEGWEKSTLGDNIVLNYGKALKADDRIEGKYPVYGSSGIVGTHKKLLVKGPGIIVGRKGNVGSVFWSSKDFHPIDTVYYIDAESSDYYLYNALQNMQFVSSDAAVPGLNRNYAYTRPYLLPPENIRAYFENTVAPIYGQIFKLDEYNEKLKQARDLLLPRLMNGEIKV